MAKYSQEFKLEVVQYFLSGCGKKATGKKFNIHPTDAEKWVNIYEMFGEAGLAVQIGKTIFPVDFKHQVVLAMINDGLSARAAAKHFKIKEPQTPLRWLRQYQEHGIDGLKPKPRGRPKGMPKPPAPNAQTTKADCDKTPAELLEELTYLRAEVAYLKKRRALRLEQEALQQRLQDLYQH